MNLQVFRNTNYCRIFYSQTIFCDYTYSHGNCSYLFICVCSTTQSNFKSYISKFLTAYQFLFEYKRQIKGDIQYIIIYFSTLHLPIYDSLYQSPFHILAYHSRRSFKNQISNSLLFLYLFGFLSLFLLHTQVISVTNYFQILYSHIYFNYSIYIFCYCINFCIYLHDEVMSDFATYVFKLHLFYQIYLPYYIYLRHFFKISLFYRFILIMLYLVKYTKLMDEIFLKWLLD